MAMTKLFLHGRSGHFQRFGGETAQLVAATVAAAAA
jgi:hypothetical protein